MVEQLVAEGVDRATTTEAVEVLLDVLQMTRAQTAAPARPATDGA
jgi:hypothetical protein